MKPGAETIHGRGGAKIKAAISRVCFTEVRLSQAAKHAMRYGMLGIGVHRDFVVKRGGNPVLYVQNSESDIITENLAKTFCFLEDNAKDTEAFLQFKLVLGFLKNMSHQNNSEFELYEEMEWRIVHVSRLMGQYFAEEDDDQFLYRVTLVPQDVKIIVFPDYETKQMTIQDDKIRDFFKNGFPMMTTVEDCKSF